MRGRIIKGIAGFYYVHCGDRIYECKAKGVFRKDNGKPLVGDWVEMDVLDEGEALGNISALLPRDSAACSFSPTARLWRPRGVFISST